MTAPRQSFITLNSKRNCKFCKQNSHLIYKCKQFLNLNTPEHHRYVIPLNLCISCLKSGHHVQKCTTQYVCRHCFERHHTLLHDAKITHSSNNFNGCQSSSSASQSNVQTHSSSSPTTDVIHQAITPSLHSSHRPDCETVCSSWYRSCLFKVQCRQFHYMSRYP